MTYASIDYDAEPEQVTGVLATRKSPFGGLPQCWVDGVPVDPDTVEIVEPVPDDEPS